MIDSRKRRSPMQIKRLLAAMIFLFAVSGEGMDCLAEQPDLSHPLKARLRAGYLASSNVSLLPLMAQNGMNAAFPKFDNFGPHPAQWETERLLSWARECRRLNIAFMPVINWWSIDDMDRMKAFNHVVTASGRASANMPCPYTGDFWERWVTPRVVGVARSVGDLPLSGILIDLEMYGVDSCNYEIGCYCDRCYARYMSLTGRKGPLPEADKRKRILIRSHKLAEYESIQREAARTYAAACRKRVNELRPNLRLGALHLDLAIPLQQGAALGFGTRSLPALCLTEKTYSTGFTKYISSLKEYFKNMGAHADIVPGIWQSRWPSANIPEQLYYCAKDTYGYWIYTMETFMNPEYHPLVEPARNYWKAIRNANAELDRLGSCGTYKTSLRIRTFVQPPELAGFVKYHFRQKSATPKHLPVARLRGTNWIYFHAGKGDRIEFEVKWQQVGSYEDKAMVALVSPGYTALKYGIAEKGHTFVARDRAPSSGIYGMIIQVGDNAVEITKASHPFAYHVSPDRAAGFIAKVPPLFLAIDRSKSSEVELELRTESSLEAVRAVVYSEEGTELWSGVVDGVKSVRIGTPRGRYLKIEFSRMLFRTLEDVWLRGVKGVLPFAATDPSCLFY